MQLKNKRFGLTKNKSFDTKCLQANLSYDYDIFGTEFLLLFLFSKRISKYSMNIVYLNP